ncbi:MAG: hypothetical protein LJF06_03575 [Gemmatimonadetes bacterium]|nr:hypothetical protein [Gemmatimonadota bacterium]
MSHGRKVQDSATDELGRDMAVAELLGPLSPEVDDPSYWMRFKTRVMRGASGELARRRLMADVTVGDVLVSWARAVVPTAVLAAALAGLMLMRAHVAPAATPARVEELLVAGMESETIPATLSRSETETQIAFASERF